MKITIYLIILISVSIVTGCAHSVSREKITEKVSDIKTEYDSFEKVTRYTGPNALGNSNDKLFIRATKYDKNKTINYQIYVSQYYPYNWRLYNRAFDSNGNQLEFTLVSREVDSCDKSYCVYNEHFILRVSKEYLDSNKKMELNLKLLVNQQKIIKFLQYHLLT